MSDINKTQLRNIIGAGEEFTQIVVDAERAMRAWHEPKPGFFRRLFNRMSRR